MGWFADIGRDDVKKRLSGCEVGTFLTRWSFTTNSFVLSFQSENGVKHVENIKPIENNRIRVRNRDETFSEFNTMNEYISKMRENEGIIKQSLIRIALKKD